MRDNKQTYFRKPLKYSQYHVLLVKTHGVWCIDCQSWSENAIFHAQREEKRLNPRNQTKIITSPTDNEEIIQKILKNINRFA